MGYLIVHYGGAVQEDGGVVRPGSDVSAISGGYEDWLGSTIDRDLVQNT